jgi:hypothetical protein
MLAEKVEYGPDADRKAPGRRVLLHLAQGTAIERPHQVVDLREPPGQVVGFEGSVGHPIIMTPGLPNPATR